MKVTAETWAGLLLAGFVGGWLWGAAWGVWYGRRHPGPPPPPKGR